MNVKEIKEILKGRFAIENERKFWEEKLKIEERKEKTGRQNEEYFRKMSVYNR